MKLSQQPIFMISKGLTAVVILMLLTGFLPLISTPIAEDRTMETQDESIETVTYSSRSSSRFTDTFDLQPDWKKGTDTFIAKENGAWVDRNFGNETYFGVGGETRDYRGLLQFDLSPLPPPDMTIQKATLKLFFWGKTGTDGSSIPFSIYRMKEAWTEGTGTTADVTSDGATWNNRDGSSPWTSAGGYFHPIAENQTDVGASNSWHSFEITDLVSKWHEGTVDNYGLMIKYTDEVTGTGSFKTFYSAEYGTPDMRPKLSVEYENSPVVVKGTAPDQWKMEEDQDPDEIAIATIFGDQDGQHTLSHTIWTGSEWGTIYDDGLLTATLTNKGTVPSPNWVVEFALKPDQYGSSTVTLNATDKIRFATHDINVIVSSVNDDPALSSIGDQVVTEEVWFNYEVTATDIEGNTLSFAANVTDFSSSDYLDNFQINKDMNKENTANIEYFPSNDNVPVVYVNITVEDGVGGIDYEQIKFTIQNVNDGPKILKVAGEQVEVKRITLYATEGMSRNFIVEAEDDDIMHGDTIKFTADVPDSDNFTLNPDTGVVFFKPANIDVPEFNMRVTVTDLNGSSDYVDIKFDVKNSPDPPVITDLDSPQHNDQFTTTDVIHFEAEYDDPDLHIPDSTEILNATWFSDIEGAIGYGAELDTTLSAGTHNITFKVKDTDPNTEAAKIQFTIEVTKAITLTDNDCGRDYTDGVSDVVSYFYNIDKEKMEFEIGGEDNIDIMELKSKRIGDNLVITLQVAGLIDFAKTYTIYLVKSGHIETTEFYKVTSTNVYDTLYKPNSTIRYGEIPDAYGKISDDNDKIIYTIHLGDLEAGDIDGFTEGLKSDFELFAISKGRVTERYETGLYSVVSYDSAGYGSAVPGDPPKTTVDGDGSEPEGLSESMIWIVIIIVIVIAVLVVLFMFMRRKKEAKVDIDYTGSDAKSQSRAQPPPQDIPYLFQSPFEQQFGARQQQSPFPQQQLEVRATSQPGYMPPSPSPPQMTPPQPQPQTQPSISCPNCRKRIMAGSRMCPYCGNSV